MKKLFLLATAVALVFSSCTKSGNDNQESGSLNVSLRIPNVKAVTRAIGAPGVTPAIVAPISNGHVYIVSPGGNIINNLALNVSAATGTGQIIPDVPADSRIFVLGNIPSDVTVATPNTLTALLATTSDIFAQTDYTVPALGNVNAAPVGITAVSTTEGTASVQIHPLFSRIELARVTGGTNAQGNQVTSFDVTGVWVDAWHPLFTLGGSNAGAIYNQLTNTDFTANTMGDTGTWSAAGTAGAMVAVPATDQVWLHHVASGGLPRLIVRVENVIYELGDGTVVDLSADAPYYITVKGYKVGGADLTAFEPGRIYKVGGEAGITFNAPDNIHVIPNPENIELTLEVEILDWIIVNPDAELY